MNTKMLDKILNEISLNSRIKDGMFNIDNNDHMEVFREYFIKKGNKESLVNEFSNLVLEKGQYPERQAFNKNGLLVTFPTPDYKADAIKRGTHFEEDPIKGKSNLFSDPSIPKSSPPAGESDKKAPPAPPSKPKTSLPVSQASNVPSPADGDVSAQPVQAQTTAAPQQTPVSTPTDEPTSEPTDLPLPPPKFPAEREADKNAIKTMLKGDDYMLDEVTDFIRFNAPHIMKQIKKKLKNYE